jgi:hypothetical protein
MFLRQVCKSLPYYTVSHPRETLQSKAVTPVSADIANVRSDLVA